MDELNKLPLKRVELSLTKFNEVAIPHHLDLLRQHKANIIKYEERDEYSRVRAEQSSAARAAARLRALLAELDALRRQVRAQDVSRFDQLTQRSRELTLRAIMDYLETSPLAVNRRAGEAAAAGEGVGSIVSTDSVGIVSQAEEDQLVQLQVDEQELALREREAALRGWSELQGEVRALHAAWQLVQAAALAQRDSASHVHASVDVAADNVQMARVHLLSAARLKGAAWGAGGAACGALCAGPVGLVVGLKAGAAAALAGSLCGLFAGRLLGRRAVSAAEPPSSPSPPHSKDD